MSLGICKLYVRVLGSTLEPPFRYSGTHACGKPRFLTPASYFKFSHLTSCITFCPTSVAVEGRTWSRRSRASPREIPFVSRMVGVILQGRMGGEPGELRRAPLRLARPSETHPVIAVRHETTGSLGFTKMLSNSRPWASCMEEVEGGRQAASWYLECLRCPMTTTALSKPLYHIYCHPPPVLFGPRRVHYGPSPWRHTRHPEHSIGAHRRWGLAFP